MIRYNDLHAMLEDAHDSMYTCKGAGGNTNNTTTNSTTLDEGRCF